MVTWLAVLCLFQLYSAAFLQLCQFPFLRAIIEKLCKCFGYGNGKFLGKYMILTGQGGHMCDFLMRKLREW
jgi:hypothetical protein